MIDENYEQDMEDEEANYRELQLEREQKEQKKSA
jgi:hypothetical protein